jgi:glycosyltransferase involved in cell wall biosynthesis
MKNTVTAYTSTKDRYFTTLPSCLISLATQTVKPNHIWIFDDGEQKDLRKYPIYENIFAMFDTLGIQWKVIFGERKGQVLNHQKALEQAETEWIWRVDDDNVVENNALEKMLEVVQDDIGAVGGLVLHPTHNKNNAELASSAIEDVDLGLNIQWWKFKGVKEVDHLYSTFIYRKEAGKHGYCMELSPVGHSEETLFSYQIKRNGWRLLVNPEAVTWHLRENSGGIRSYANAQLWEHDKQIFRSKLKEWGIKLNKHKFFVLENGLGDHLAFKKLLPEIRETFKDFKLVIAVCYPEVFENEKDIKLVSIQQAKTYFGKIDQFNIYKFM